MVVGGAASAMDLAGWGSESLLQHYRVDELARLRRQHDAEIETAGFIGVSFQFLNAVLELVHDPPLFIGQEPESSGILLQPAQQRAEGGQPVRCREPRFRPNHDFNGFRHSFRELLARSGTGVVVEIAELFQVELSADPVQFRRATT